jgi:hypothetical protein
MHSVLMCLRLHQVMFASGLLGLMNLFLLLTLHQTEVLGIVHTVIEGSRTCLMFDLCFQYLFSKSSNPFFFCSLLYNT